MHIEELITIDIETASQYACYDDMNTEWRELWAEKTTKTNVETNVAEWYVSRAGVMAEFSKVICISIGYFDASFNKINIQSIYGYQEHEILEQFIQRLHKIKINNWCFAGHNIREFDIPFLCRRLLINNLPIPDCMNFQNKKPWELRLFDTFQYWRFGDYKNFTSLKLLAHALQIPSPKNNMDGSMVGVLYWEKNPINRHLNMIRIAEYCSKDVETTMLIILKLMQHEYRGQWEIEQVNHSLIA